MLARHSMNSVTSTWTTPERMANTGAETVRMTSARTKGASMSKGEDEELEVTRFPDNVKHEDVKREPPS
jgi:hypothetical protein